MKKRIAILFLAAAVLLLPACSGKNGTVSSSSTEEQEKQHTQETLEYTGIYWRTWREEIGGTVVDMNSYIILNEDHTGYWIGQDVGTLTWDEGQLMLTVGATYEFALTQENGRANLLVYEFRDDNGEWLPTAFEKIEKLPAQMEEMLGKF